MYPNNLCVTYTEIQEKAINNTLLTHNIAFKYLGEGYR